MMLAFAQDSIQQLISLMSLTSRELHLPDYTKMIDIHANQNIANNKGYDPNNIFPRRKKIILSTNPIQEFMKPILRVKRKK